MKKYFLITTLLSTSFAFAHEGKEDNASQDKLTLNEILKEKDPLKTLKENHKKTPELTGNLCLEIDQKLETLPLKPMQKFHLAKWCRDNKSNFSQQPLPSKLQESQLRPFEISKDIEGTQAHYLHLQETLKKMKKVAHESQKGKKTVEDLMKAQKILDQAKGEYELFVVIINLMRDDLKAMKDQRKNWTFKNFNPHDHDDLEPDAFIAVLQKALEKEKANVLTSESLDELRIASDKLNQAKNNLEKAQSEMQRINADMEKNR